MHGVENSNFIIKDNGEFHTTSTEKHLIILSNNNSKAAYYIHWRIKKLNAMYYINYIVYVQ